MMWVILDLNKDNDNDQRGFCNLNKSQSEGS